MRLPSSHRYFIVIYLVSMQLNFPFEPLFIGMGAPTLTFHTM